RRSKARRKSSGRRRCSCGRKRNEVGGMGVLWVRLLGGSRGAAELHQTETAEGGFCSGASCSPRPLGGGEKRPPSPPAPLPQGARGDRPSAPVMPTAGPRAGSAG